MITFVAVVLSVCMIIPLLVIMYKEDFGEHREEKIDYAEVLEILERASREKESKIEVEKKRFVPVENKVHKRR